jgi:hypothetical protein
MSFEKIRESVNLAGEHLLKALSPQNGYLPYWCIDMKPAAYRFLWPAHNIGRWWDAMLRLKDATGFVIPSKLEDAMLKNVYTFFNNPDHLCIEPISDYMGFDKIELHSLREGLLALYALVRYRNNKWAADMGHQMLETVNMIYRDDGSWDLEKLNWSRKIKDKMDRHFDPTGSHGRMIEAIIRFYQATGDELALRTAERFARYHMENSTSSDGKINYTSKPDHTHSYFGTLRGLLLFGELTRQRKYIDRVEVTYRVTVRRLVKQSGFVTHDLKDEKGGEITSPGDAAQIALWLARHGYTEYLDDAERIVRSRILPSQIVEDPGLTPKKDDGADEHNNLGERAIGAYGGCHMFPHAGKHPVTDVTAAALHSLVDIYNHIVVNTPVGLAIQFHFDYQDKRIKVVCKRKIDARITITSKTNGNILIRIPGWTPKESITLTVNGKRVVPLDFGIFVCIPGSLLPGEIVLRYALPERKVVEHAGGKDYIFLWRGDEILGVTPNNRSLPFYQTLED